MKGKLYRLICALLCLVTLTAVIPTEGALAADFTDLESHWAKEYMLDLVQRGYLTGYSDGSIRPDGEIRAAEALVLLSRLYSPDEYTLGEMSKVYGVTALAAARAAGFESWASNGILVCLGVGVITAAELAVLDLAKPMDKEYLSVLLCRAMQLDDEAEALISVPLAFDDVFDISSENRCYVYMLLKAGVISGNTRNEFLPSGNVTRGVMSKMFSVALDWLADNGGMPVITGYEKKTVSSGILRSVKDGSLRVTDYSGVTRLYTADSGVIFTLNGTEVKYSDDYAGLPVEITVLDSSGMVERAALTKAENTVYVSGTLLSAVSSGSTRRVTVSDGAASAVYTLATSIPVYMDGSSVSLSGLTTGSYVVMTVVGGIVSSLQARSAPTVSGTVVSLEYGSTAELIIQNGSENYWCEVSPYNIPTLTRGTASLDFTRLKKGDSVTAQLIAGNVVSVVISGQPESVKGRITKITSSSSSATVNYTITVELDSGVTKMYEATNATSVYNASGVAAGPGSLCYGDNLSISLYGGEIVEIVRTSVSVSAEKTEGAYVGCDNRSGRLVINVPGRGWVYLSLATGAKISVLATGVTLAYTSLIPGMTLTAYGSYTNSSTFLASAVYVVD